MEKEKHVFWHPALTPAFIVVGTDAARDMLIQSYAETGDGIERFWIAKALIEGWFDDPVAEKALSEWLSQPNPALSGPLARWIARFEPDPVRRRDWLIERAKTAARDVLANVVSQLLEQFPDDDALAICATRLEDSDVWYYRRVELEAQLAAASPRTPFAELIFQRALSELDGPPIALLVGAAEHSATWKRRVMDAALPSALGVRQAVASVFRDRVAPTEVLDSAIPNHLAEVSGPVRTTVLCALAAANRNRRDSRRDALVAELQAELGALGTYYQSRRLSAVTALTELGEFTLAASALTQKDRALGGLISTTYPDPVAMQTLLSHLHALIAAADQSGHPLQLGRIEELMGQPGMLDVLATNPHFAALVDEKLREPLSTWDRARDLELAAARWKGGDLLRQKLVAAISGRSNAYATCMTAAKLLARHFAGRDDVWSEIQATLTARTLSGIPHGVLGHLVLGWPTHATALRALISDRSPLDDLVFQSLDGNSTAISESIVAIVQNHHPQFWRHLRVGQDLLLEWAALPVAPSILADLALDDNGTKSLLAIEIISRVRARPALPLERLKDRFNDELSGACLPREAFDVFTGQFTSWTSGVFSALKGATPPEAALHSGYMAAD
jgi:hypothetical protein